MSPRENENNAYANFWGDNERALWYVMVFSGVVNLKWCTCVFFHHQRVPYRPEYLKHRAEKNYIRCLCYVGYSVNYNCITSNSSIKVWNPFLTFQLL